MKNFKEVIYMESKENKCESCHNLDAFYTKGYCKFLRTDYGYCYEHKKVVAKKDECCEFWKRKAPLKRKCYRVIKELEDALTNISVLHQVFTESAESGESCSHCRYS